MAYIPGFNEAVIAAANTYLATGGLTPTFSDVTITGGTTTVSNPVLDMTQTWNNAGVTFTGLKFNVTDTASASGSLLMDLQVGGASKFSVVKTGEVISASDFWVRSNAANAGVYWGSSSDVFLTRDAANTLALRNGADAQVFNIYNTYTDASNYERASIGWIGNQFLVTPNSAGTGAGRSMFVGTTNSASVFLGTAGAGRWEVNSSGHLRAVADNAYDIGAVGADRPRNGYFGSNLTVGGNVNVGGTTSIFPALRRTGADLDVVLADASAYSAINASQFISQTSGFKFSASTLMSAPADGLFRLLNNAGTDFTRLILGPNDTSCVALKKSGTQLQVRLGDDTGDAGLAVGTLSAGSSITSATYVKTTATTVGALGSASTAGAGARRFVTDANATMAAGIGTAVVGGGANAVPVYSNGTDWLIG